MLNALPSPLALPATANASNAAHPAAPGSGSDSAPQNSELRGGFARALEQAAASDASQEAQRPRASDSPQAPEEGVPRDEPNRRQGSSKSAASRIKPTMRLEPGLTAPTAVAVPAGQATTSEALTPGSAASNPNLAEDATSTPAASPENGGVGALLLQLQAAAVAATQGDPAAKGIATKSGSAKASLDDNGKLAIDDPAARRSGATARGEPTRQVSGADPTLTAAGNETRLLASLYPPSTAASLEERPGSVAVAAAQPTTDATQLLSPPALPAGVTTHNAPNLPGGAGSGNATGEARLSASPGSPDFGPQLGAQVTTFVRDGLEHARLQLHPADMGPVLVQIQLDGQTAQVHLSAEHAVTRQALEDALPQLASQLREAGLTLSGGGVSEQAQQGRQAPSDNPSRSTGTPESARPAREESARAPARRGVVDLVA